jgi:hypothetical protein
MIGTDEHADRLNRAQLFDEPGPSPIGAIPLTPRAKMILGFGRAAAAGDDDGKIAPRYLILGVIAESRDRRVRGLDGPHHLEQAATAAGTNLAAIESILLCR